MIGLVDRRKVTKRDTRISRTRIAVALIPLLLVVGAQAADRLLPTEDARKLTPTFRKDGNALYVMVQNDSSAVLTSVTVKCVVEEPTAPAPQVSQLPKPSQAGRPPVDQQRADSLLLETFLASGRDGDRKRKRGEYVDLTGGGRLTTLEFVKVELADIRLLPGKQAEGYAETPKPIGECALVDPRGRPRKAYELF